MEDSIFDFSIAINAANNERNAKQPQNEKDGYLNTPTIHYTQV